MIKWIMTIRDNLFQTIARDTSFLLREGRVLDVGTGKGGLVIDIARQNPNLEVYGVDTSPQAIAEAGDSSQRAGLEPAPRFEVCGVEKLPFDNNYFDLVVSTFSFHHWSDPFQGLNEVYRVLKPGGQVWIYDHWKDPNNEAKKELQRDYGWLLSNLAFLHLRFVHSALLKEKARRLMEDPKLPFQEKELRSCSIFLFFKFRKNP